MSITTEIQRLQDCVSNAYSACSNKGAVLPQYQNSANLPSTIQTINALVQDPSQIVKYVLEDYNLQTDDLTAKQATITLTGKFEDIDEVDNSFNGALRSSYAFYNNYVYNPKRVVHGNAIFSKLKIINGVFADIFAHCEFDQGATVSFPVLTTINGDGGWWTTYNDACFIQTFIGTSGLSTVSFGGLTTMDFGMYETFMNSQVANILFPNLTTIGSNGSFAKNAFRGDTALQSISFPSLTTIQNLSAFSYSSGDISDQAFYGCTNLTEIHFKSSMQSRVQALNGYSSLFGATNATIYFDL